MVTQAASFRKGAMFDKFRPFVGNGLITSQGAFHLRQRRLIQPAFHRDRIAGYAQAMQRTVAEFTDAWQPGEVRQVNADMQMLAAIIVGRSLFAGEFGRPGIEVARESLPIVVKQGMVRALMPGTTDRILVAGNRRFDRAVARMRGVVHGLITQWRTMGDQGDLLSMLLATRDEDGTGMTDEEIYDEVVTLLSAGIETSALALAWLFHEIGRNPEVEHRLCQEIDEVLGGRPAGLDDVAELTYTKQVVNEVLRMYPIWLLMRRTTEDVELAGVHLPPGTEVTISPHTLHFDPRSFADPGRFDPDRWAPDRIADIPRGAFIPFGGGNRQCIGNVFAQTEMVITVATIAARWRLRPIHSRPTITKFTNAAYPVRLDMTAVPRD
nr:cytochrome P450 [Kibdelosporangium sp. MJ126-NF4]